MISLPKKILIDTCQEHTNNVVKILDAKIKTLSLCLEYYQLQSKASKKEFIDRMHTVQCLDKIKLQSINWFLKKSTNTKNGVTGEYNHVLSLNKPHNFFDPSKRVISTDYNTIKEIKKRLEYFKKDKIRKIISGNPADLLIENELYNRHFSVNLKSKIAKDISNLLNYIFDYDEFSNKDSIFTPEWGAYRLTSSLKVNTCLYCNRNYVITVINNNQNFIRAEIDHFFAQSSYPILSLSFYNLIPSCHICNSNLKKATDISLVNNLHPYMNNYCDEQAKFTYQVNNPGAFFHATRGLSIMVNTSKTIKMKMQIENNIELFKLDYIYDYHKDIAESLLDLQRKTVKKSITDIYNNILVDNSGRKIFKNEKDLYEFAIRNYFTPTEFYKRPLAKFEKDIAEEIGLI